MHLQGQLDLKTVLQAVREACRITRVIQLELSSQDILQKSDRSPVTVADFAVQAIIAHHLVAADPTCVLVGEESGEMLRPDAQAGLRRAVVKRLREAWPSVTEDDAIAAINVGAQAPAAAFWTLDPIDGTKGFMRNGQYAISLAYIENGRVQFGVLGCPNLSADLERPFNDPDPDGLIIHASRGNGCWSRPAADGRDTARRVQYAPAADGRLRMCGSAASGHSDQAAVARVAAALGGAHHAHLDSQAKYAVVARGQADAFLRIPLRADDREYIWDHAPGEIIATEAGACVSDMHGRPFDFSAGRRLEHNGGILCASPDWQPRIVAAIAAELSARDTRT